MFGLHLRGVLGEVDTLEGESLQGQQCPKISKSQAQKIKHVSNREMGQNVPGALEKGNPWSFPSPTLLWPLQDQS